MCFIFKCFPHQRDFYYTIYRYPISKFAISSSALSPPTSSTTQIHRHNDHTVNNGSHNLQRSTHHPHSFSRYNVNSSFFSFCNFLTYKGRFWPESFQESDDAFLMLRETHCYRIPQVPLVTFLQAAPTDLTTIVYAFVIVYLSLSVTTFPNAQNICIPINQAYAHLQYSASIWQYLGAQRQKQRKGQFLFMMKKAWAFRWTASFARNGLTKHFVKRTM